jgi:hypothetical protein
MNLDLGLGPVRVCIRVEPGVDMKLGLGLGLRLGLGWSIINNESMNSFAPPPTTLQKGRPHLKPDLELMCF